MVMGRSRRCRFDNSWLRRVLLLLAFPIVAVTPFIVQLTIKRCSARNTLFLHKHNEAEGLYVHIPYCRRRCNYCDFAIVPIGGGSRRGGEDDDENGDRRRIAGFEAMDFDYKRALLNEIRAVRESSSDRIRLRSIYFGGGTPSLAPPSTLRDVVRALVGPSDDAPFYLMGDDVEMTIEMDPGTFDLAYLEEVKRIGFNRISLGVQSFDDDVLAAMGRVHRVADVRRSVDMIGQVFGEGDANYSIDLISGAPGLTLAKWAATLSEAARLRPRTSHMSLYDLQVEEGTAFGKWYGDAEDDDGGVRMPRGASSSSRQALPSVGDCAFMYSYASGYLHSRGYEHYEISSYALRGPDDGSSRRSEHNQIYWKYDGSWYAVGLGATSNVHGVRFARPRALSDYIAWTEGLAENFSRDAISGDGVTRMPPWLCRIPKVDDDLADGNDNLLDIVMTRLRTSEGLDLDWVAEHGEYGEACVEAILRGFELALDLNLGDRDTGPHQKYGCIRLNDPKGFLFSNNIISNVFVELSDMDSGDPNLIVRGS